MTTHGPRPSGRVWDDPRIVAPDEETWAGMSPSQRESAVEKIVSIYDEYLEAMSEGTKHFRAKSGAAADLDGHFRRAKRQVFLACELAVIYPGEAMIAPDVIAVTDTDPDLEIDSWVVADRKRGIDFVLEVRNTGAKHKDLVENVRDYARLRIPEYFSFDCKSNTLRGWRLSAPGAKTYQPIMPQGGSFASQVLGLELAVVSGRVRFFMSGALVPTADELVSRLQAMADQSQRDVLEIQQEAAESKRLATEATERRASMRAGLVRSLLRGCERRGIALSPAQRARVDEEDDPEVLSRWLDRVFVAPDADALLADG